MDDHEWPSALVVTRPSSPAAATLVADATYVDSFWTPLVGALGVSLFRTLSRFANAVPGTEVVIEDLAAWVGETSLDGVPRTCHALEQLAAEQVLGWSEDGAAIWVPADLPTLRPDQVERLPDPLRTVHQVWRGGEADEAPSATTDGLLAVASFLDEARADPSPSPLRTIQRWQQAIRMASDFHDDLVLGITESQIIGPARRLTAAGRTLSDAVRRSQGDLATLGFLQEAQRADLRRAAVAIVDCLVTDHPEGWSTED